MNTSTELDLGLIETFAGNGKSRSTGDGKRAVKAGVGVAPTGLEKEAAGPAIESVINLAAFFSVYSTAYEFKEAAPFAQNRQAFRDKITRQCVEYDVNTPALCRLHDFIGKINGSSINDKRIKNHSLSKY